MQQSDETVEYAHVGVMCDGCGMCPLLGERFCLGVQDFCEACATKNAIEQNNPGLVTKIGPPKKAVKPVYPAAVENNMPRLLLIIDSPSMDWKSTFEGAVLPCGCEVEVVQCEWADLSLTAYCDEGDSKAICNIRARNGQRGRTVQPDFVLLRNEVHSLPPHDFRNTLMGLEFAQIPCINSYEAVHGLVERPRAYAALNRLQQRLGTEAFPLISQYYYPNFREMQFTPDYPIVAKVAHGQAGYGKMKVSDHKVFQDLGSVMAMTTHYVTAEPFLKGEYDIRIQKIGDKYKCWKRQTMSGEWKTNTGTSLIRPLVLTEQYKMWADEASTLFGGLDILSVDAVHCEDGKEFILEVNGSSSGFMPDTLEEDNGDVRDLVLARMAQCYPALRLRDGGYDPATGVPG